ncbi:MAG: hypothetical protein L0H36_01030 [bacterium]|nr:hypothetical protein [bacterium]MDN5835201.1 hypothetical protein [bacterium]
MAKYVFWRVLAVDTLQATALVATVLAVWYVSAVILHLLLGDLIPMEQSQIIAFILVSFAAMIVLIYLWIKQTLLQMNQRLHRWAHRR